MAIETRTVSDMEVVGARQREMAKAVAEDLGGAAKGIVYALLAIETRLQLIEQAIVRGRAGE